MAGEANPALSPATAGLLVMVVWWHGCVRCPCCGGLGSRQHPLCATAGHPHPPHLQAYVISLLGPASLGLANAVVSVLLDEVTRCIQLDADANFPVFLCYRGHCAGPAP